MSSASIKDGIVNLTVNPAKEENSTVAPEEKAEKPAEAKVEVPEVVVDDRGGWGN